MYIQKRFLIKRVHSKLIINDIFVPLSCDILDMCFGHFHILYIVV